MTAEEIERAYLETVYGYDEPKAMYLSGKTLREFAARGGHTIEQTSEGHPIDDHEMYCLSAAGVFLVE